MLTVDLGVQLGGLGKRAEEKNNAVLVVSISTVCVCDWPIHWIYVDEWPGRLVLVNCASHVNAILRDWVYVGRYDATYPYYY